MFTPTGYPDVEACGVRRGVAAARAGAVATPAVSQIAPTRIAASRREAETNIGVDFGIFGAKLDRFLALRGGPATHRRCGAAQPLGSVAARRARALGLLQCQAEGFEL